MSGLGGQSMRERLSRRTSTGTFIPAVDGLRFIAICAVVAFHIDLYVRDREGIHSDGWLENIVGHGDVGVLLFFGISGFILGLPFARAAAGSAQRVSISRYLRRRVTRLEPPYIVAMTVLLAAFVLVRGQDLIALVPHYFASLAYAHNGIYRASNPIDGVVWSLEIEIQFYLLAPVFALAYRLSTAWLRRGLLGGAGLTAALLQLGPLDGASWRVDYFLLGHLQHFMAGMILADVVARRVGLPSASRRRWRWSPDIAGVCGLVVLFASQTSTSRALVLPIGIAACLFAAVSGQLVPRVLSVSWVYIIGGMCYSIYLYHYAVISLVGPTMTRIRLGNGYVGNMAVQTLLLGSAVMVISAVFFVLVERPCMDPNWPAHMMAGLREPRRLLARLRPGARGAPAASARDEQSSIVS